MVAEGVTVYSGSHTKFLVTSEVDLADSKHAYI